MKDYFERYRAAHRACEPKPDVSTSIGTVELTELTIPSKAIPDSGFVSSVSNQRVDYPQIKSINDREQADANIEDDPEIAWRIEVMLPQIPDTGPIPFLVAREAIEPGPGKCHSCGDPLRARDGFICAPCGRAKNLALELAMLKNQ